MVDWWVWSELSSQRIKVDDGFETRLEFGDVTVKWGGLGHSVKFIHFQTIVRSFLTTME